MYTTETETDTSEGYEEWLIHKVQEVLGESVTVISEDDTEQNALLMEKEEEQFVDLIHNVLSSNCPQEDTIILKKDFNSTIKHSLYESPKTEEDWKEKENVSPIVSNNNTNQNNG